MESCCRACSRSDDFRRFSLYAVAEVSQEVIANMIRDTSDTQVSTEDGLPQQICPDCLMTLSLAYSFRKQCRRSDAKFREYWGGRTPLQSSVDHQQQHQQQPNQPHQQLPRRSQSQVPPDESSFEAANIKEEVDIYDYEYSVPSSSHDNQWVIQNPRTIGDGPMTVVHNTGGQYYDEAAAAAAASETSGGALDRDGHGMMHHHPMDDPSEMGECSGLGMKGGDKLKKNVPSAERTSQRIRRQEMAASLTELVPRENDWGRFSVSVIPEASLLTTPSEPTTGQRCQHCMKKMKKPYKHRNGKCLEPRNKASNRPKCAYCHQTFSSSKGIPAHLRNSCRVYRQVCEAKGISLPPAEQSTSPYDTSSVPSETPEPSKQRKGPVLNAAKQTVEQKPKAKRATTNWSHTIVCQYCSKKFLKKQALNRHLQKQCLVWVRKQTQNLAAMKSAKEVTTGVPLPLPPPLPSSSSPDDKSAIFKDHQPEEQETEEPPATTEEVTNCVYCQQSVSKKTRFLHHNGRCVVGRVNAEHPCPHCPEAFMTRNLLLKHRCDPALKEQDENSTTEAVPVNAVQPAVEPVKQRRRAKVKPKQMVLVTKTKTKTPVRQPQSTTTPRKKREVTPLETPTSIVKREFCSHCRQRIRDSERQKHDEKQCLNNNEVSYNCGYCRKGFAARDSLIEHQRICTVRKQHKQVKCQFCGSMISNRGNLKKHQKDYCKSVKRPGDVKSEEQPDKQQKLDKPEKPQKLDKPPKPEKPQKLNKPLKPEKLLKLDKSLKPEKPQKLDKPPKPEKPQKLVKAEKSVKAVKSEKPLKLKKVKATEEPVKKKRKIKTEKSNHSKSPDEDVENIPLKQRKLHKPKPMVGSPAVAAATTTTAPVETKKQKQKPPVVVAASSSSKKLRFPCEYCKRKFETEQSRRKHGFTCNVKRANLTIVCPHCSARFSRKGNLQRHLRLKCKNIDRDKTAVNETINELMRLETTADSVNSTLEENDVEAEQEPVEEPAEQDPLDPPSDHRPTPSPVPEEETYQEPVKPRTSTDEPPMEPEQIPEELPQTPTSEEEPPNPTPTDSLKASTPVEEPPQNPSPTPSPLQSFSTTPSPQPPVIHEHVDEVPEAVEEEIILPEEPLPTTEEEEEEGEEMAELQVADDLTEPEEPLEEEDDAEPIEEAPSADELPEPDNNNAEVEKTSSPDVRSAEESVSPPPEDPPTTVIERHDDDSPQSAEVAAECDPEEQEPIVEPMQVDHAAN